MSTVSGISGVSGSAESIRADYMYLLITQLRNQNPLEPMDNNQMASQLAQLSQLEQLEGMNKTFQQVLLAQQFSQASDLIGKVVAFVPEGEYDMLAGVVSGLDVEGGKVLVRVGQYAVELGDIESVRG